MVGTLHTSRDRRADGSAHERRSPRYQCASANLGRNWTHTEKPCSTVLVTAPLDATVLEQIDGVLSLIDTPRGRRELGRVWDALRRARTGRTGDDLGERIAKAERARATWSDARATAYPDWKAGHLTDREYAEIKEKASGEIDLAERELEQLRAQLGRDGDDLDAALPPLAAVLACIDGWGTRVATAERRAVLAEVIERVEAVRITRGRYRARIKWTERGRALRRVARALGMAARGAEGRVGIEALAWANDPLPTRQPDETTAPGAAPHAMQTPAA
jgi:hypothetical protein